MPLVTSGMPAATPPQTLRTIGLRISPTARSCQPAGVDVGDVCGRPVELINRVRTAQRDMLAACHDASLLLCVRQHVLHAALSVDAHHRVGIPVRIRRDARGMIPAAILAMRTAPPVIAHQHAVGARREVPLRAVTAMP